MPRRGQALIMVTLAAFALCGVLGLAVDLGWAHFTRKAAQAAADAAAMAAATATLANIGQSASFVCGSTVYCTGVRNCSSPTPVPPANSGDTGCLYAERNGFAQGGAGGRQNVTVQAGVGSPPAAPGVTANYWVTTRVTQSIPQLFASLISAQGKIGASATAAIVDLSIYGSLMLLNRENDCVPMESPSQETCGVDLLVSANDNNGHWALQADGGIFLASQKNGTSGDGRYAGENSGGGTIHAPFTYIRGNGSYHLGGSSQWIQLPTNAGTNSWYQDPMRGKGQPKAPAGLPDRPVPGGTIQGSDDPANPVILQPGNYFATNAAGTAATGAKLDIRGHVRFSSGGGNFGSYVFFGGVNITNPATVVTFDPGVYVMAGVKGGGPLFSLSSNAVLKDRTEAMEPNTDAGELFIFTDTNYRGQGEALQIPALVQPIASQLVHGTAGFQSGNSGVSITLHGLNRTSGDVPPQYRSFTPVLMWQDQSNSVVKYTSDGNIDTSCGNPDGCPNTGLRSRQSPQLVLQGSASVYFYGAIYQPRGAWTSILGGGDYLVPVQVVAGALRVQGNANFSMVQPATPIARRSVALVQ
ncbi:MAG: pilus assembly protein TadG-related protein [Bryobacteraceae bacterium]